MDSHFLDIFCGKHFLTNECSLCNTNQNTQEGTLFSVDKTDKTMCEFSAYAAFDKATNRYKTRNRVNA